MRVLAIVLGLVIVGKWAFIFATESGGDGIVVPPVNPVPAPPERPERPVPEPGDLTATWYLQAHDLRPELKHVEFEIHYDGLIDSSTVIDAGDVWGVVTKRWEGGDSVLHGISSATGEELWKLPLDGAYCAAQLQGGNLVCAEVLEREKELGTRWRLMQINPATGDVLAESVIDAWLATMSVHHDVVIIVEARQPAPHAVVRGFDASLSEVWSHDLSKHEAHERMFSENRSILRDEEIPEGPAFMNPRMRMVGDGTSAIWMFGSTAFVDARTGTLRAMLPCSRPVDDDERIWCNHGDGAKAYDYAFKPLYSTEKDIGLAFPARDPKYGDVLTPVFLRDDGKAMRVDRATGRTLGTLVDTATGDAFGMAISPNAYYAGGHLIVSDSEQAFLINPSDQTVVAELSTSSRSGDVFLDDGMLILDDYRLQFVDPKTGRVTEGGRNIYGFSIDRAGDEFFSYGLDELALLELG